MIHASLPLHFATTAPDVRPGDTLIPPASLVLHGYVRFKRTGANVVHMRTLPLSRRWAWPGPLFQVERAAGHGGYLLQSVPPGGTHVLSVRALRRIKGHGVTVAPSEAYGFLLGWPQLREIHVALPVGRTRQWQCRDDLFAGMDEALPLAEALADERGLSVMGCYCTTMAGSIADIGQRLPARLAGGWLVIADTHGGGWWRSLLVRLAAPHGWLPCPWNRGYAPIREAPLNPRRMHTAWLKRFGPIDYGHCEVPEPRMPSATDTGKPARPITREPEHNWFTARQQEVPPATLSPEWQWLAKAIADEDDIDIAYDGGSAPGKARRIQPLAVFTVEGYPTPYLRAVDVALGEDRVFRLDRLERAIRPGDAPPVARDG